MSTRLEIRPARVEDAERIASIHIAGWQWAYEGLVPHDYLDSLPATLEHRTAWRKKSMANQSQYWMWVAVWDDCVAAFVDTCASRDDDATPDTAEVAALYLQPDLARQGIGRALVARALDDLRDRGFEQATLWMLPGNERGRKFYEGTGWRPDGAEKFELCNGIPLPHVRYHIGLVEHMPTPARSQ